MFGRVEWVGEEIADIEVGEAVFCTMGAVEGMSKARGGQLSPSVTGRDGVWKLPPDVDPLACAGLVLTQVGYNAGIRPDVHIGDGAIVGAGSTITREVAADALAVERSKLQERQGWALSFRKRKAAEKAALDKK